MVVAVAVAVAVAEKNTKTHGKKNGKMKVATLFCHQVGQIWSYRAVIFFPCSKSRDLGPEHGFRACSFKNKGNKLDFHIFGVNKKQKMKNLEEIGQMLVSRALDLTKKIRKIAADIFAKSGLENLEKRRKH